MITYCFLKDGIQFFGPELELWFAKFIVKKKNELINLELEAISEADKEVSLSNTARMCLSIETVKSGGGIRKPSKKNLD